MKNSGEEELIQGYLDGRLSEEEVAQLEAHLLADPKGRARFLSLARLDSGLKDRFTGASGKRKAEKPFHPVWWFIGSCALILLLATWFRWEKEGNVGPNLRAIATVSAEADAHWKGDSPSLKGQSLTEGIYELSHGLAQIDFFQGASLSLTGPARIEMVDSAKAILHSGRIRVEVPPAARGFEIVSGNTTVEDLGTSFGISADAEKGSNLIVFDGEVKAHFANGKSLQLNTGDAVTLSGEGPAHPVKLADFPGLDEIIKRSIHARADRYSTWKSASERRKQDSRLIAYYDFEDLGPASRRLANRAVHGFGPDLDGGIVGARVQEGRWPGKTALDFRREGDRVRFMIPGEFDELTLVAWVRIDALDRGLNSLFLTDHYGPNEIHWQLSNQGALHFACSPKGAIDLKTHNRRFYSDRFWTPQQSGRWFMLATTAGRNGAKHFINGEPVGYSGGANRHKPLPRMKIGTADLGNWTEPINVNWGLRTLNGRVDEFAIYHAKLTPEEIARFYDEGKP